ncbi:MAG: TA system antitoxin ParD family protein [Pseudonocardiaceae bacterium]
MATTSPTRIDDELYASAKLVGGRMSRSAAQQIAHWARIGRELEASHSVSYRDIADVLDGRRDYDELTDRQQAVVRAEWTERITERREGLDLAEQFARSGRSYVELDTDGNIVRHAAQDGEPAGS